MKLNMLTALSKKPAWNAPESGGGANPDPTPEPPAAPDFSFVPEEFKTDDGYDGTKFRERYDELASFKAQTDERLSGVPEDATGYDFAFPEKIDYGDISLPEGFTLQPLADDDDFKPLFEEFGGFLHKIGAPAGASKDAMALIAKYEAMQFSKMFNAGKAEIESLKNGKERIATVQRAIESRLPEAQAKALMATISSADGIRAMEQLLTPKGPKSATPQPAAGEMDGLSGYELLKRARASNAA